jgi:hypothetical protein
LEGATHQSEGRSTCAALLGGNGVDVGTVIELLTDWQHEGADEEDYGSNWPVVRNRDRWVPDAVKSTAQWGYEAIQHSTGRVAAGPSDQGAAGGIEAIIHSQL